MCTYKLTCNYHTWWSKPSIGKLGEVRKFDFEEIFIEKRWSGHLIIIFNLPCGGYIDLSMVYHSNHLVDNNRNFVA